jgi:hypothetical protein
MRHRNFLNEIMLLWTQPWLEACELLLKDQSPVKFISLLYIIL